VLVQRQQHHLSEMSPGRPHLESLDVFRGATITAMILVNNPGNWDAVFPALVHADWNGLTAADVVFPFFVFIMGCAMPFAFAFARRDARPGGRWRTRGRLLRRAVLLVGLGLALNLAAAWPQLSALRVPGVLQRLGVTYLIAALIVQSCGSAVQAVLAAALLLAHWAAMTLIPFGGHAAAPLTKAHNLAGFVDAAVFGAHTLLPGFDPEGLVGTVPAIATALAGALAGRWLQRTPDRRARLAGLTAGGAAAIGMGLLWSMAWPINKPIWTGSYALLTSGLAAVALAGCIYWVDDRGHRRWARPFLWLGVNPLAIYFCAELTGHLLERPLLPAAFGGGALKDLLHWGVFAPLAGDNAGEWASLAFAAAFVSCWIGVAALLYRRGIRIRV
jgi:predicted acyltransferase